MSSDQPINTRSTRSRSAMENKISLVPNKPELGKMEESVQLQGMKRRADVILNKQNHGVKRFALGNLTNAESDNLQSQQSSKAAVLTGKDNPSNDSKVAGSKSKGVTKILTRAAMRLARNVKKPLDEQEKPVDDNRNKTTGQFSALTSDFAKINVGADAVLQAEIAQATGEKKNTKKCTTTCRDAKNQMLNVKPHTTINSSNDFELSDNSLYLTALETQEEDNNLSTENETEKATEKEENPEGPMKEQDPKIQEKTMNTSDKTSEPHGAAITSKNIPLGVLNNNEQKKLLVGETSNVKIKKQMLGEVELTDDGLYVSAIDSLDEEASSSSGRAPAAPAAGQQKLIPDTLLNAGHKGPENEFLAHKSSITASRSVSATTSNVVEAACDTDQPRSPPKRTPEGVEDFDKIYWNDVHQVSEYAQDIFEYLRERESLYVLKDYMKMQPHLTCYMRSLLVDWMVEIQESFELNHETLYLAVKIVDAYLSRVVIERETLQLVAAAGMLIAAKYDERVPPTVDDFIYICDGAYERKKLLAMERTVFRTIGFDLGFPLSYRFLRRYARVTRVPMEILTLARYILETSLMDYDTVVEADSKLACAALFIAQRMFNKPGWNKALEFYTGYMVNDFKDVVILLNNGIWPRKSPLYKLTTVSEKYSHELFFQVSKRPVITTLAKLFETTDVLLVTPTALSALPTTSSAKTEDNKTAATQTSGSNGTVA